MFFNANNHTPSSRGKKVTDTLPEQATKKETVTHIYATIRKIHLFYFIFHSVNVFKSVRRVRSTFFVLW